MPFDFDKLKNRLLNRRPQEDEIVPVEVGTEKEPKPGKMSALEAKLAPVKQGLGDIKATLEEGNIKLFVKQVAVILLACWGVWTLMGKMKTEKLQIQDHMSAISLQQTHQDEYLTNKDRLLRLEPLFPDMGKKNEWLIQSLMKAFSAHTIQADINGNAVEKAEANYTMVSQEVSFRESFANLGNFLADVESGNDFLRVSNLTIGKLSDTNSLGKNTVSIRFNTVFPKEKYAKRLFKDYDQQMKKIEQENASTQTREDTEADPQPQANAPTNSSTEEQADASK